MKLTMTKQLVCRTCAGAVFVLPHSTWPWHVETPSPGHFPVVGGAVMRGPVWRWVVGRIIWPMRRPFIAKVYRDKVTRQVERRMRGL